MAMATAGQGTAWHYLVLYDGECGLCDRSVQLILRHDRRKLLQFAPLQGATAAPIVAQTGTAPGAFDTMIYVEQVGEQRRVYQRSAAVFRILSKMGGAFYWLSIFRIMPTWLMNVLYNFIAKRRMRWFGRLDACRVPDEASKARFLP